MNSQQRIVGLAAVACVAVVAAGASFMSRALVLRSAESASMMAALRHQSKEIERLSAKLDAIDCSRRTPVATAAPELSPEQLDRVSAAVATKVVQANAPSPPPPPTPENVEAFEAGQSLIAAAVGTGHWTEANAKDFHALFMQVSDEERRELKSQIAVAINNDKLRPDFRGHWF